MNLNTGDAILAKMTELADEPAGASKYTHLTATGDIGTRAADSKYLVEECWGHKGLYRADNIQGVWIVSGPFTGQ